MNAPKKMKKESDAPIFEPFPKPQTMPEGWDFSGLTPESNQPAIEPAEDAAES
jgi:hypothetical protein